MEATCEKCDGNGWYYVDEWIGGLQGRKDCNCGSEVKQTTEV